MKKNYPKSHTLNPIPSRRGFTLIEMLVVIGIIGLLASVVLVGLTNARKAGRDARRLADIRTIQNALELYYNKCGIYPGGASCGQVTSPNFTDMANALKGAGIGVSGVPRDPLGQGIYQYFYTSTGQEYILSAVLEDASNKALDDDLDAGFCADPYYCVGVLSNPNNIPGPSVTTGSTGVIP